MVVVVIVSGGSYITPHTSPTQHTCTHTHTHKTDLRVSEHAFHGGVDGLDLAHAVLVNEHGHHAVALVENIQVLVLVLQKLATLNKMQNAKMQQQAAPSRAEQSRAEQSRAERESPRQRGNERVVRKTNGGRFLFLVCC